MSYNNNNQNNSNKMISIIIRIAEHARIYSNIYIALVTFVVVDSRASPNANLMTLHNVIDGARDGCAPEWARGWARNGPAHRLLTTNVANDPVFLFFFCSLESFRAMKRVSQHIF